MPCRMESYSLKPGQFGFFFLTAEWSGDQARKIHSQPWLLFESSRYRMQQGTSSSRRGSTKESYSWSHFLDAFLLAPRVSCSGEQMWTKREKKNQQCRVLFLYKEMLMSALADIQVEVNKLQDARALLTILDDDLQGTILIPALRTGKDILHIIPR